MRFSHRGRKSPESSEGFKPWMGHGFPTGHVAVQATDGHVLFPGHGVLRPSWEVETIYAGEHPREGQRRDDEEAGSRYSNGGDSGVNIAERRACCDHSAKAPAAITTKRQLPRLP